MGLYLVQQHGGDCLAVVGNLLFCSLEAYPLARMRFFAGRGPVLPWLVATMP